MCRPWHRSEYISQNMELTKAKQGAPRQALVQAVAEVRVHLTEDRLDQRLVEDLIHKAAHRLDADHLDRDHLVKDAVKVVEGELVDERLELPLLGLLLGVVGAERAGPAQVIILPG